MWVMRVKLHSLDRDLANFFYERETLDGDD